MTIQDKIDAARNKISSIRTRITGKKMMEGGDRFKASDFLSDIRFKASERLQKMPMLSERPLAQRAVGNKYAGGDLNTGMSSGIKEQPESPRSGRKKLYY